MTFQVRHAGRTYTVRTLVGGDEFTRVEFLEEDPAPAREAPIEPSGEGDE